MLSKLEGKQKLWQFWWDKEIQARDIPSLYLQKSQMKKVIIRIALKIFFDQENAWNSMLSLLIPNTIVLNII